jgi:PPOX class probable F420-dependent enzyme
MIDFSGEFGQRAYKRLQDEEVLWLTTTDSQGIPQPRPVWFLWDGETILVFSQPQGFKVAHIQQNPRVALNLNCTFTGGDVVVLLGEAEVMQEPAAEEQMQAYLEKYERGLEDIHMTEEQFRDSYHTAIRIRLSKLRGH